MQNRLTHYFIGLYLTLCSLGQVQATTDPFEELVKTTTQRLNAQIKQNALNERHNQAHLNRYILYLGGKDWKNNNTDTSWVRDDTDETIRESQLKALDRQAKEGMFAQAYKDAGFHMVYIGDYTIHLNSLVSVEDLASLRTLDKLKDPKKVEAQHLARVNQNILSTIAKIKEGIEWTSFNRTNKMLYIYLRIRFVYSDSNYKTIAYRQLTGERSLGGKAQAYISEATRGNMYDLPIIYLKNKVPKLRDAIKEVMDGRAEIKEETPILASFDMNWNTSTSTSIDAQLLSGVGTVDEMTSQHAQNAQIEFMDYTGHYQANSAEQKNLRLFLNFDQQEPLAAYRLAKKIIIRVTNQNTPKEIRHAIAQFELPANAVLIWLDFDASKQSFHTRIRYGEGLRSQYLSDKHAADRYLQAYFEAVMVKAIDVNEWVNGKNAMRFLAFLTDNLGYIIKQTQLPEVAWNPEKNAYLMALPRDVRLRWAMIAGVYNGAIQEISGVPDLVALIAKYFYDPQVYAQINGMLEELSISGLVQSMGKAAVDHAALYKDPNVYKVHHQAGKDIFGIVSFLAPILKAGKVKNLADLRLVLLRMVDFRPSAKWLLQVAKKSALTLKQEGQKLLIYADRQATRLLASIENGMIRLEQTLDELSGGRLLGSFDEAQVITPDGRTITTKVELWEKDNKVYMKGDKNSRGSSGNAGYKYPNKPPKVDYSIFNPQIAAKINLETRAWFQAIKDFGQYEEVVYVLYRTDTKEFLKVGSSDKLIDRFKKYVTVENKLQIPLELEIYKISDLSKGFNVTDKVFYETTLRNKLIKEGHDLLWDNTDYRLGKSGQGIPNSDDELKSALPPPNVNTQAIFNLSNAKQVSFFERGWTVKLRDIKPPIVYILRDADNGKALKVGYSSSPENRFRDYTAFVSPKNSKFKGLELNLTIDIFEINKLPKNPQVVDDRFYETVLRNKLLQEGEDLPYDNTKNRLGRSGSGF